MTNVLGKCNTTSNNGKHPQTNHPNELDIQLPKIDDIMLVQPTT